MRYFSYNEWDETGGGVVTLSEKEIRDSYWDYWYGKMCEKFGKDVVDANYAWEDCLDNWIVVNWAWEVKE
jgi:hypothetical protein